MQDSFGGGDILSRAADIAEPFSGVRPIQENCDIAWIDRQSSCIGGLGLRVGFRGVQRVAQAHPALDALWLATQALSEQVDCLFCIAQPSESHAKIDRHPFLACVQLQRKSKVLACLPVPVCSQMQTPPTEEGPCDVLPRISELFQPFERGFGVALPVAACAATVPTAEREGKMPVSKPTAAAIIVAADETRIRREAVESARRVDALNALVDSCRYISETLEEWFGLDAKFELAPDGFSEETPKWFVNFGNEIVYTEHDIVLTGWMSVAGDRVADVRATKSVLDRHDAPDIVVHVVAPRRWLKPKRTRVRDVVELRAALALGV